MLSFIEESSFLFILGCVHGWFSLSSEGGAFGHFNRKNQGAMSGPPAAHAKAEAHTVLCWDLERSWYDLPQPWGKVIPAAQAPGASSSTTMAFLAESFFTGVLPPFSLSVISLTR